MSQCKKETEGKELTIDGCLIFLRLRRKWEIQNWKYTMGQYLFHISSLSEFVCAAFNCLQKCSQGAFWCLLLDDLVDLELVHGLIIALNNLAVRWHVLDLEPARNSFCKLLNLPLSLWSVKKLAILLFVIQLVNKQMHLKGTSPAHLEDVPNRRSQTTHRLFFLPVHLVVDGLPCLLLALSHFVLHPLNQTKSFNGETSLTAESL